MEGISTHVYKGIKTYWKRRGYKRLNKTTNTKKDPVDPVHEQDPNPVRHRRKKRFFRVKLNRRMRIWKKLAGFPKKLLTRLRDAYVNMMLHIANSGLVVGGAATGFGGSVGVDYGYGMSDYRTTQLKEYDEKVIVEIYKSLMIAQGQIGNAAKITTSHSQPQLKNSPKISISTR